MLTLKTTRDIEQQLGLFWKSRGTAHGDVQTLVNPRPAPRAEDSEGPLREGRRRLGGVVWSRGSLERKRAPSVSFSWAQIPAGPEARPGRVGAPC